MKKSAGLVKSVQLRPHQLEAINKYLKNGNRGIFAHSLGSGKTITSIAAIEQSNAKRPLILTPAALQKNYKDSIDRFVNPKDRKKYTIMSYEKFRMDPNRFMSNIKPDSLVVDEFHRSKDPTGKTFQALQLARPHVNGFLGLTATAIQNHPDEIFPLLDLVKGSKTGITSNRKEFEKNFITKEKVYPKGFFSNVFARLTGRYGEKKVLKNSDKLQKIIKPFVHRNDPSPEFMSHFPSKNIVDIETPMTPRQAKMYKYFMTKDLGFIDRWRIKHDLPPKAGNADKIFAKLINARQIANSPMALSKSLTNADPMQESGKLNTSMNRLFSHLKENPKNKVMVYSNFTQSTLNPISKILDKKKIPYSSFTGKISKKIKNLGIEDYNKNKHKVLLVSPSGAEGLDLKGTTLLQNLDPHWNPAKMDQVFGRAVRYKSHEALPPKLRNVKIERYKSIIKPSFLKRVFGARKEKTIDDYIYNRAHEKEDLNKQMSNLF